MPTAAFAAAAITAVPAYKPFFSSLPLPNQPFNPAGITGLFVALKPPLVRMTIALQADFNITDSQIVNVRYTRSVPDKTVASVAALDPRNWDSNLQYLTVNYTFASPTWSSQVRFGHAAGMVSRPVLQLRNPLGETVRFRGFQ